MHKLAYGFKILMTNQKYNNVSVFMKKKQQIIVKVLNQRKKNNKIKSFNLNRKKKLIEELICLRNRKLKYEFFVSFNMECAVKIEFLYCRHFSTLQYLIEKSDRRSPKYLVF